MVDESDRERPVATGGNRWIVKKAKTVASKLYIVASQQLHPKAVIIRK